MLTSAVDRQTKLRFILGSLLFSFSIFTTKVFATPNWQGPYVGAYLGSGFGNNHVSTNAGAVTNTSYFTNPTDINMVNEAGTWVGHPNSIIGGVQAGHDWVWKQMIYGVALDYSLLSLSSSKSVNNAAYSDNSNTYSLHTSMSTNWLFTLRGRVGYQTLLPKLPCPSLLYLTGGMALTQVNVSNNFSDNSLLAGTGTSHASENKIGWVAGAGIELAAFTHTSMVLEYLYVDIPSVKTTNETANTQGGFGIPTQSLNSAFSTSGQLRANLLKIGLNYRFDE